MNRKLRFALVGCVGFAADAMALYALLAWTGMGPFVARLVSIAFALTVTWLINRHLTFGPSNRGVAEEAARYGGVGIFTSLFNYAVYAGLIAALPGLPPLVALAVASLAAMALSYVGYLRLVFNR